MMRGMLGCVVAGLSLAVVGCSCSGEGPPAWFSPSDAPAEPLPEDGPMGELYFPTTVGAKRVIGRKGYGGTSETTETVTQVEEKDGVYTVTVERVKASVWANMPNEVAVAVYRVSSKGVFLVSVGDIVNDPPAAVLKRGVKVGYTWASQETVPAGTPGSGSPTSRWTYYTLGREEVIEVPAGRFRAVRVEWVTESGGTHKSTSWHAAGVGIIKTEMGPGVSMYPLELKAFTPGQELKKDESEKVK